MSKEVDDLKEVIEIKQRISNVRQIFGFAPEPVVRGLIQRIRALKNQPNQQQPQGQQQGILQRLFPSQAPVAEQQPIQSGGVQPIQPGQRGVVQPSADYGQDEQSRKIRRSQKMSVKNTEED